jgi:predicted transcriptional regulator
MDLDKARIEKSLTKKGFIKRDNDHRYFIYETIDGERTEISTKTSHGSSKSIGDSLIAEMAKQCRLKKEEFLGLINCPLNRKKYEDILRKNDSI